MYIYVNYDIYGGIKMRKFTKITSIVLVLVTLLSLCSGCMRDEVMTTVGFGVPFAKDSEAYAQMQLAIEDANLFTKDDFVKIELVSIPEDEAGKKAFLKDVESDKIGFFLYQRDELVTPMIESGKLASLATFQEKYPALFENKDQFVLDTSTDANGVNHLLALRGTYQGVFFNEDLFVDNGLQIPKTWEQFTAVVDALKAKGITPIAGGFADVGLQYVMDELILMEGGVAEHSYVPKYGVVNSWTRAINDLKSMVDNGFFNADCAKATHEQAKKMFSDGKAAMIIGASDDIANGGLAADKLGVFSLPVSTTGKKEIGDIICNYDFGVYVNSQFLKKKAEIIDAMAVFIIEYLDALAEDNGDGTITEIDWGYKAFKTDYSMPGNKYSIGVEELLYDEDNNLIEVDKDPTIQKEVVKEDSLQERVFDLMEATTSAGRSLSTEYKTFDYFIGKVRDYLSKGGDIEAILVDATAKEVEAQGATETPKE